MVDIGNKLKALRLEHNLTQKQVAHRIGVAISAVSSYESGTRYPSYDSLIKLAHLFHTSTDHLLGLEHHERLDISDLNNDDKLVVKATIAALREKYNK